MVKTYGENLWWKLNPSAEEWHDCHSKNIFLSTKYFQTSTFKNWNKIIFHQVHDKNSDIKSVLFQSLLKWSFIACLLLKLTVTQHFLKESSRDERHFSGRRLDQTRQNVGQLERRRPVPQGLIPVGGHSETLCWKCRRPLPGSCGF